MNLLSVDQQALNITMLSNLIKESIEVNPMLKDIWVRAEISNVTYHSSGHIYLTLKDENSLIGAAFFKYANRHLKERLKDGMQIFAYGSVGIYPKRSNYQFIIKEVMTDGSGDLQRQIEELKKKLKDEGLFDESLKQKMPFLPKRIGVVTSPTGAAFRDILKVGLRRYPTANIILAPAKVQGDDAAKTIIKGIKELNKKKWQIDVIIAGRGGGSFEDLMPFNEEAVVRAYAESQVPIVSAVGHQIDHPLSDEVADLAAATPSAAAELVFPDLNELEAELDYNEEKLIDYLQQTLATKQNQLEKISQKTAFAEPLQLVAQREMLLKDQEHAILLAMKNQVAKANQQLLQQADLRLLIKQRLNQKKNDYLLATQQLEALSPLKVLQQGYAVVQNEDQKTINSIKQIKSEEQINVILKDGQVVCQVKDVIKGEKNAK